PVFPDHYRLGLREKTLIVFVGDNGTGRFGADRSFLNGRKIQGQKGTMLEGGSRVPLLASWKGTMPEGRVMNDLIDFTDFFATFAELAGAKMPEGITMDSHSFAPQLRGEKGTPRDWVYVQLGGKWYVCDHEFKLNRRGDLFDMTDAPFVQKPISADTKDEAAVAGRRRLQAVLDTLSPATGKTVDPEAQRANQGRRRQAERAPQDLESVR
ncbi:MAG TPA: hypothetical protein DD670_08840, partial [Planctomycetaceae bacterium]|nr:hypothetical protein [Planctomycetaceae bacterium]